MTLFLKKITLVNACACRRTCRNHEYADWAIQRAMRLLRHDRMIHEECYSFLPKVPLYLGRGVQIHIIDF